MAVPLFSLSTKVFYVGNLLTSKAFSHFFFRVTYSFMVELFCGMSLKTLILWSSLCVPVYPFPPKPTVAVHLGSVLPPRRRVCSDACWSMFWGLSRLTLSGPLAGCRLASSVPLTSPWTYRWLLAVVMASKQGTLRQAWTPGVQGQSGSVDISLRG